MEISEQAQADLVDMIKNIVGLDLQTVDKYDGELSLEEISDVAISMPAVLVFYKNSTYQKVIEQSSFSRSNIGFEILVCSNNLATRGEKQDEVLKIKDVIIRELSSTSFSIKDRNWLVEIESDSVIIRDPAISIASIIIKLAGYRE